MTLGWRVKPKLLPGGVDGMFREIALTSQQITLAASPQESTHAVIGSAEPKAGGTGERSLGDR